MGDTAGPYCLTNDGASQRAFVSGMLGIVGSKSEHKIKFRESSPYECEDVDSSLREAYYREA
jgi:hypothetical protein